MKFIKHDPNKYPYQYMREKYKIQNVLMTMTTLLIDILVFVTIGFAITKYEIPYADEAVGMAISTLICLIIFRHMTIKKAQTDIPTHDTKVTNSINRLKKDTRKHIGTLCAATIAIAMLTSINYKTAYDILPIRTVFFPIMGYVSAYLIMKLNEEAHKIAIEKYDDYRITPDT